MGEPTRRKDVHRDGQPFNRHQFRNAQPNLAQQGGNDRHPRGAEGGVAAQVPAKTPKDKLRALRNYHRAR